MKILCLKLLQITLLTAVVLNVSADLKSDMNNAELSLAAILQQAIADGMTIAGAIQQMIEADPTLASGIVATAMIVAPEQYRENISAAIDSGVPAVNVVTSALFAVTGENAEQIIQAAIEFAPGAENEILAVSARILPQVGISKKLAVIPIEQEILSVSVAGPSPTPEAVIQAEVPGDTAYKRLITRAEIIAAAEAAAVEWMSLEEAAVAAVAVAEIAALAAEEASINSNAASIRVVTAAMATGALEAAEATASALAETARLTEAIASAQKAATAAALVVAAIQATEAKAIANSAKSVADTTEAAIKVAEEAIEAVIVAHGGTLKAALAKVEVAKVEVDAAINTANMVLTKSEIQASQATEDVVGGKRALSDLARQGVTSNAAALDAVRAAADAVLPLNGVVVAAAQILKVAELRLSAVNAGDDATQVDARADVARATFQAAVAARTHADAVLLGAAEQLRQLNEAQSLVEAALVHQGTAEQAAASVKHSHEAAVTVARLLREIMVVVDDELALLGVKSEIAQQRLYVAKAYAQAMLATDQAFELSELSDAAAIDAIAANTARLRAQQQATETEASRLVQELEADAQRLAEAEALRLEDIAQQEAEEALVVTTVAFEEVDQAEADRFVAEEAALLTELEAEDAIELIDDLIDNIEDGASPSGLANAG